MFMYIIHVREVKREENYQNQYSNAIAFDSSLSHKLIQEDLLFTMAKVQSDIKLNEVVIIVKINDKMLKKSFIKLYNLAVLMISMLRLNWIKNSRNIAKKYVDDSDQIPVKLQTLVSNFIRIFLRMSELMLSPVHPALPFMIQL
ncbi:CLUMA_CG007126, isoform A [Clunio marinus]|uniref:CLUMA_CG007126, isoform A n=1 Tax=Clunio marinus TaxID=568069 RepID=A0A1J1I5D8_9DIPT|nr:CLUMA_CG007126, isoform A [Clunio marinus]